MPKIRIGTAALIVAMSAAACSSSNNATGTAGSTGSGTAGTTGVAGATGTGSAGTGGTGGAAGTGGSGATTGDAGAVDGAFTGTLDAGAPYPTACASTVRNKGLCMTATDVQCANTCGPNRIGYKNCNCYSDAWDCPRCEYVPGDYSCYRLPDPLEACPPEPENDAGSTLPMVGSNCTRAACSPCGSATLISYLDSAGAAKVGYCVCGSGKWSCASTTEWPQ